jgi:hypothetical protein
MSLVFIPLSTDGLRQWAATGGLDGPVEAHAVTPGLVEAFAPADEEDAERTALLAASVAALGRWGHRLVAVTEVAVRARPDGDDDFGEVLIDPPPYALVTSLFADEPELDVTSAAAVSSGPLAEAWEQPQVRALLSDADLLWYGPGEWIALV